jgi:hypothetical protein
MTASGNTQTGASAPQQLRTSSRAAMRISQQQTADGGRARTSRPGANDSAAGRATQSGQQRVTAAPPRQRNADGSTPRQRIRVAQREPQRGVNRNAA